MKQRMATNKKIASSCFSKAGWRHGVIMLLDKKWRGIGPT